MASRMIHYVIANKVLQEIDIENVNDFLVGAIIPDCWELDPNANRITSHFMVALKEQNCRGCDFKSFANKYLKNSLNSFCLGYFLHLITDTIYLRDIQSQILYNKKQEDRKEIIENGYNDMKMYNTILLNQYHFNQILRPLKNWDVTEITPNYQIPFLNEFDKDFIAVEIKEFKVHNVNSLERYIDKAVKIVLKNLRLVINNKECENSCKYMISNDIK